MQPTDPTLYNIQNYNTYTYIHIIHYTSRPPVYNATLPETREKWAISGFAVAVADLPIYSKL